MKRFVPACLLLGLFLAAAQCIGPRLLPGASDEPGREAQEIDKLIRQLGDDDFAVREEATRRLMTREDAVPALRKALRSPDQETARRATKVLEALNHKEEKRVLARLQELGRNGQVDQAAELLVRRQKWDDEEAAWQVMTGLAAKVIELANKEFGEKRQVPHLEGLPAGDFRRWADEVHPNFLSTGRVANDPKNETRKGGFVVRAAKISVLDTMACNLLVAAGKVQGPSRPGGMLGFSVIIAGGSVEFDDILNSVVVCDGDFTGREILTSLIVARGEVRCSRFAHDSRIVTSASVHLAGAPNADGNQVKEKEATPLGFVKFFDPAQAGIAVSAADAGVRVESATKDKPFARAGLQAGDLVVALDGRDVTSPESFRRLLRTALAEGGEMVLKVRRAGRDLDVRVTCPD
jgi:hypothetical protein